MKHSFLALLVLIPLLACQDSMNIYKNPDSIIDVKQLIPDAVFDLRYASSNNFTGKQVPGYEAAKCLLDQEAAHALQKVQQNAKVKGLRLIIFDCYRPQRAVSDLNNCKLKIGITHIYPSLNCSVLTLQRNLDIVKDLLWTPPLQNRMQMVNTRK